MKIWHVLLILGVIFGGSFFLTSLNANKQREIDNRREKREGYTDAIWECLDSMHAQNFHRMGLISRVIRDEISRKESDSLFNYYGNMYKLYKHRCDSFTQLRDNLYDKP